MFKIGRIDLIQYKNANRPLDDLKTTADDISLKAGKIKKPLKKRGFKISDVDVLEI